MADNSQNHPNGDSVLVPEGFSLQPLATGLNFPTAIAFSEDETQVWVSESGALPGTQPRIVQLNRLCCINSERATRTLSNGSLRS
jgi:hypothetical protein